MIASCLVYYAGWPPKLQRQIKEYWPPITPVSCPHCPYELYCSESCLNQAWNTYHKILCPSVNPETIELYRFCANRQVIVRGTWNSIFSPMIMVKLIAIIILTAADSIQSKSIVLKLIFHRRDIHAYIHVTFKFRINQKTWNIYKIIIINIHFRV